MKVLITSRNFGAVSDADYRYFTDVGYEVVRNPHPDRALIEDELVELYADVDAAVVGDDRVTPRIIDAAKNLKVISKMGIGVDSIDIPYAQQKGIVVTNAPGANAVSVADLTMGLILDVARQITYNNKCIVEKNQWPKLRGVDLPRKTLGIIGLGRIGKEVAKRAWGFDMKVICSEPYPDMEFIDSHSIELKEVDEVLQEADFVTLHAPHIPGTPHLIDARRLALMKPTAYLINPARGELIDEEALYTALTTGKLAGAAADTLEHEPPRKNEPLLGLDNFVLTSHIGGSSKEAILRTSKMAAENVIAVLSGKQCKFIVK